MSLRGWKHTPGKPDKRSPAQKAAHTRAFQIFQLRGLYSLCHRLTEPRRSAAQAIIDAELAMLGAETEQDCEIRRGLLNVLELVGEIVTLATGIVDPDFEEVPF